MTTTSSRPEKAGRRIAVIGAGFTGTTLAVQLAERFGATADIFLFERSGEFGQGVAYATTNDRHLLNVPAGNMSAVEGDTGHFLRWLKEAGYPGGPETFVKRGLYGSYLKDLLDRCRRITKVTTEVVRLDLDADAVVLRSARGRRIRVDQAVLCIGNFLPASPVERRMARASRPRYLANPWNGRELAAVGAEETVVLIGSGLTMIDVVLDLQSRGHRGRLVALSRHGLLPNDHSPAGRPRTRIGWPEVPASAMALLCAVRSTVAEEARLGGNWRSIVDSLRPYTQTLWQGLSIAERRRFLRHLKPYWEVHRHRLAPLVASQIERLRRDGRLQVVAAHVREVVAAAQGVQVKIRERGSRLVRRIDAGWIVNCSGPALDYERVGDPLMRSMFKAGRVRHGPLLLGLDVDDHYRLIDAAGVASPRLFAIGPPLRGVLWETTAVPDIRRQCAVLAEMIGGLEVSAAATGVH
ncbi:MAG: FAD/NAD(P)-binding protein [Rhodospirillales bacterium]|nr:FAD/NAD(P)-binding protein [Rhodospirillales bacterium]